MTCRVARYIPLSECQVYHDAGWDIREMPPKPHGAYAALAVRPSMQVVVPREAQAQPYNLMQWRREEMEVSYVNELDPVALVTFATVALATVMLVLAATGYSFATWAWNLNVMGVA